MKTVTYFAAAAALLTQVSAHLVITYPGWRGNNLHDSGRTAQDAIPEDGLGVHYNNASQQLEYPYGMQWIYPCKLLSSLKHKTQWGPID
jgi:hypothetical protein